MDPDSVPKNYVENTMQQEINIQNYRLRRCVCVCVYVFIPALMISVPKTPKR
jgi:hypothetical protein